jgi:catalase
VVHARGFVCYGEFEATGKIGDEPASKYTRAKLFQQAGKKTPLAIRFSTVIGGRDSSEVARDPRGFAVKFYTEDGNWDLVGNNLGGLLHPRRDQVPRRDPFAEARPGDLPAGAEPDLRLHEPDAGVDAHADASLQPARHPGELPAHGGVRRQHLQDGERRRRHGAGEVPLPPAQGVASLTAEEAAKVQGQDLGSASKDLFTAIEMGDFPQWDMYVQIMEDHDHPELDWDPLDDTKIWPEKDFPLRHVGVMTLNRNVEDFFNENEQIAMGTGVLVDGLDFSDDKMLVGRTFSYSDTQRYRVGANYLQLPVNQPKGATVATNQSGGQMSFYRDMAPGQNPHVNYEPSIHNGLREAERQPNNNRPRSPAG